jgi:hypothetical protein
MQRAAQRLKQTGAAVAKKGPPTGNGRDPAPQARRWPPPSDDELAAFYADLVNSDRFLPPSTISNTMRDAMLARAGHARAPARARGAVNGMVSRPRHGLSLCAGGGGLDMGLMLAEPGYHTRASSNGRTGRTGCPHRSPARGILRPGPDLDRPAQLRRPALPRGLRHRPRRISLPALQRRRESAAAPTIPATSGPTSPASSGMPPRMGLPRKRRRSRHPRARDRPARALGHGLHACGGSVQRGRSRRAAPAAAHLHPGPHR